MDLGRVMESRLKEKEPLLKEIVHFYFKEEDENFRNLILTECLKRETEASTMMGKGIAFPHAVLEDRVTPRVLCCFSKQGVPWNSSGDRVRIIIMLVCNREDHLSTLSELASILQMPGVQDKLEQADHGDEVSQILLTAQGRKEKSLSGEKENITDALLKETGRLASRLPEAKIILFSNSFIQIMALTETMKGQKMILVTSKERVLERKNILAPFFSRVYSVQGFINDQKEIMKKMWSDKILETGDVAITLSGFEFDTMAHGISISSIPGDLYDEARVLNYTIPHKINLEILSRVISLASELSRQGREGKPAGTIFVVGEYEQMQDYCRQLIINPFGGLKEHERSILDPGLSETIKEFSKIDGAYIIGNSGYIHSGGTYLSVPPHRMKLQPGLGARHAAALGITLVAPVASVVISESTGHIRVFWDGVEQDIFSPDD
ncbi:MAG: PTS sugar transporter subunit IIA [Spirochaetales bacterium]|nr:PTS sugar transporter subunit IIA [Spirochaetales bacterium]